MGYTHRSSIHRGLPLQPPPSCTTRSSSSSEIPRPSCGCAGVPPSCMPCLPRCRACLRLPIAKASHGRAAKAQTWQSRPWPRRSAHAEWRTPPAQSRALRDAPCVRGPRGHVFVVALSSKPTARSFSSAWRAHLHGAAAPMSMPGNGPRRTTERARSGMPYQIPRARAVGWMRVALEQPRRAQRRRIRRWSCRWASSARIGTVCARDSRHELMQTFNHEQGLGHRVHVMP